MKLLSITIGKAWSILKREGLWRGGKHIVESISQLIPCRLSGEILIISSGVGDSARYRGAHVAEELRRQGFRVAVTTQYNPFLVRSAEVFRVFIFHRTLYTGSVRALFDRAKALRKTIIFETDDLVYDPAFLRHMDYYQQMNGLEKKLYEHGVGSEILKDPSVEVATAPTSFLAEKLREQGKIALVVPNRLSAQDLVWSERARKQQQSLASRASESSIKHPVVRIGYLSGTPSHNKDFATITNALLRIMATYQQVELVLAGPLDIDDTLYQYHERITRLPFVSRRMLFQNIASLDINLAPLKIGNPFCESKSELKFFEAGIVEVPTVAAATQTFREAITDGVDGYIAETSEEWYSRLSRLIEDAKLRQTMGRQARKTALARYTTKQAENEAYYRYLRAALQS